MLRDIPIPNFYPTAGRQGGKSLRGEILDQLRDRGLVCREGAGKRGQPHRWWKPRVSAVGGVVPTDESTEGQGLPETLALRAL